MRFAWLRSRQGRDLPPLSPGERLTLFAYNAIWWIPAVASIIGLVPARIGFVAFLAVTVVRALVNGYRINVMPVLAAERLPLRSP